MYKKIIIIASIIITIIAIVYFCTYDKGEVLVNYENNLETDDGENIYEDDNISNNSEELSNNENVNIIENNNIQDNVNTTETDIIGNLNIEKIGLNAPIKQGSTSDVLSKYVGHIEDTPTFDGNVGLAAHNRGNIYSYFSRLNELEEGDKIIYKTNYWEREYIVDKVTTILETDWSMLKNTNENRLTLITCIRNRPNQRLCVQAIEN